MFRSCTECKKFIFDGSGKVLDNKGNPIERRTPPDCTLCEKYDEESKQVWNGFIANNYYIFNSFLICYKFHCLPRVGGSDVQDSELMGIFILLSEMFEKRNEIKHTDLLLRVASRK